MQFICAGDLFCHPHEQHNLALVTGSEMQAAWKVTADLVESVPTARFMTKSPVA